RATRATRSPRAGCSSGARCSRSPQRTAPAARADRRAMKESGGSLDAMDDPLLRWRAEFPIAERTNYQISNSLGAMPQRARDSLMQYADAWSERGVRAWGDRWWNLQFEFAALVERILGVDAATVSMHQNVAMASEAILSCFDFPGERNRIVYTDLNFPS